MKKSVLLTIVLICVLSISSYAQKKYYSEVYVVNGIEAYILSEPVRPYEVVYGKGNGVNWTSTFTGGLINNSISTKVGKFIKSVLKKAEKEGKSFDAIIYTSGKNVAAVKFTDEPTKETKQKAKVRRLNGIPTYVMCEPYDDFRVVKSKGGGIKWKSALTGGLVNNSIEEDLVKFAKKYRKMYDKRQIDALYYTGAKSCDAIIFSK